MEKPILITGGTGLVGANVARKFADEGFDTICYDVSPREINFLKEVSDKVRIVRGDICDWSQLVSTITKYSVEGIIHPVILGWENFEGYRSIPLKAIEVNTMGTAILLEVSRLMNLKKFVYISSAGVLGAKPDLQPLKEDDPVTPPPNLYFYTKYMGELLTEAYNRIYGMDTITVRVTQVYGPPLSVGSATASQLEPLIKAAIAGESFERPYGGDHPREFSYVRDLAEGIFLAYSVRPIKHRVFHITSGMPTKWKDAVEAIKKVLPEAKINLGPGLDKDLLARGLIRGPCDITRAREELGYSPKYDLEKGIKEYVEWLKASH